jgi:alkylation response protein AidB-like acyl-CoA dehydrogenase
MDFNDTPEEAQFRAEVRRFLDANATRKSTTETAHRGRYIPDANMTQSLARAKEWQAKKADAGFAAITWPKKWGGRGGSPIEQVIYNQEEANYAVPRGVFEIGLGMCIPTMMAYATPEQLERHVRPALRGEDVWCQLFSEPAAGSDLAGLRTRAERSGDDWIVNGQKIWTSGAHFADFGIIVTRTDPNVPKHEGLTFFFLSMKSPGIEVRRIKQISGTSNFNEVFFTDVRVPDSQRLGKVGDGWKVSLTTLMNERLAVGDAPGPDFDDIFALTRSLELDEGPAIRNPAVREKLALVREDGGTQIHQVPHHDGAVARPDSGAGSVDHQTGQRQQAAGDCLLWHRPHGHERRRHGWRDRADGSLVSGGASLRARHADRRRQR